MVGYYTNRVVVIEKDKFKYSQQMKEFCGDDLSIECFFQPLGKCTKYLSDEEGHKAALWIPGDEDNNEPVLRLRCRSSVEYRDFVPKKLREDVSQVRFFDFKFQFHENPLLFYVGHFTHYFMRPTKKVKEGYEKMRKSIGFRNPIQG